MRSAVWMRRCTNFNASLVGKGSEYNPDLDEERQTARKESEEWSKQVELLEKKRSDMQKHLQSDAALVEAKEAAKEAEDRLVSS